MTTLQDIVAYCDQRTRRAAFKDAPGALNGLQLGNPGRVTRIGAAVDAGLVPFARAAAAGVDFLIVHHGMYWDMPRPLTGPAYARVATLVNAHCALYSSHLPLDAHPRIGNNALLARQLGLRATRGFLPNEGGAIGRIAPCTLSRAALRMTVFEKRVDFTLPPLVNSMKAEQVSRSTCGLSEQMPLLSRSGSIGTTRSAR